MSPYYCSNCSNRLVAPASPNSFTGTQYQLDKYIKHTSPTASYNLNSVFADPTYPAYSADIASALASGYLEVDVQRRKSLLGFARRQNGVEYRSGVFSAPTEGIKVVWPESNSKLHAFPITAHSGRIEVCASCGKQLPMF